MKELIHTFSTLGARLAAFDSDQRLQAVARRAVEENPWFSPGEIRRAVLAIAEDMLEEERLVKWLAAYDLPVGEPRRVLVIMAGNIPLVGFFDLLCVTISGNRCLVKPAAKDHILMECIIGLLHEIDPQIAVELYDGHSPIDALIATGSDNAERYFRTHYAKTPALLRGTRQSVAILDSHETEEQLAGLADDIWAYSGLGCRNVSLVFLPRGAELKLRMPAMNPKFHNNYRSTRALLTMEQRPFVDLGQAVAVEGDGFPTALSMLVIKRYSSLGEVEEWLRKHDRELQCVVTECVRHNRRAGFGQAQSPALTDYPDERDVIAWLIDLDRNFRK